MGAQQIGSATCLKRKLNRVQPKGSAAKNELLWVKRSAFEKSAPKIGAYFKVVYLF